MAQDFKNFISEEAKILQTFVAKEDGVEVRVAQLDKGFSVTLKDIDSGQMVQTALIFPTLEQAVKKAKEIFSHML